MTTTLEPRPQGGSPETSARTTSLYAASVLSGLVLTPVIIDAISKEGYGAWIFIGSLTIMLRLLDFGITPTVVRFTAFHRGRETAEEVDASLRQAWPCSSSSAWCRSWRASSSPGSSRDARPRRMSLEEPAQVAAVIAAFTLGAQAPLGLFGSLLKGAHRFDVLNTGAVLSIAAYALLVLVVLTRRSTLPVLATSRSSRRLSAWGSHPCSSVASCPGSGCRARRSRGTASRVCSASRGLRSSATSPARSSSRPT